MIGGKNNKTGFTIVELLIVIVIIGILAAITIVAYNGIQTRARNTAHYSEMKAWVKSFEMYKATNGTYPIMADGGYCLGTGFPDGDCRNYLADNQNTYDETNSVALMNALKTVSSLPSGPRTGINGVIGPYVQYTATEIQILHTFHGGTGDCPDDTVQVYNDNAGLILCWIELAK